MTTTARPAMRPPGARARRRRPRRRARDRANAVAPWFGDRQGRLRALRRGGPEAFDALQRQGLPGLRRPQAPRHPEHRRACARARSAATASTFLNFHAAGGETMLRAGVDGLREGAARRGRTRTDRARGHGAHQRPDTSTRSTRGSQIARDAGCDGVVCAGTDVATARRARAAHDGARHPARGWRRARPGAGRHAGRRDRARRRLARDRPRGDRGRRSGARRPRAAVRVDGVAAALGARSPGDRARLPPIRDARLRILRRRCRPRRSPDAAAPCAHPRAAPAALQKAAEARRKRAEVKAKLKAGSLEPRRPVRPGRRATTTLAKLKVVSVLESLPGVGKVQARRHHGGARHQREPPAPRPRPQPARRRSSRPPEDRPRRLIAAQSSLVLAGPVGGRQGHDRPRLLERDPTLLVSVSATTRDPRPGEVDGVDYRFVTRDEFEALRDAGGFLEWFEVYGHLKGTPRAPVEDHLAAGRRRAARDRRPGRAGGPGAVPRRAAGVREAAVARGAAAGAWSRRAPTTTERARAPARRRRRPRRRRRDRFDAVVVNDDVDASRRRGGCYPGRSRRVGDS